MNTRPSDPVNWRGRLVRDVRTNRVGRVTADLRDPDDVLGVWFGPGEWNSYTPNAWSKEHLFELVDEDEVCDEPLR